MQEILHFVVPLRSPVVQTIINKIIAEVLNIAFWVEANLKLFNRLFSLDETVHHVPMAFVHHFHQRQNHALVL